VLNQFTSQLATGASLSDSDIGVIIGQLTDASVDAALKADLLEALSRKGETPEEIAAFARELRARSVRPAVPAELRTREILDVVGTGGDRLSTFNISTTVAILASAAGVLVAKHGNRASTSPIGSADVMEALGIPFDLSPEDAIQSLKAHGFTYFFAPRYHPAFKNIVPARKLCAARGQTTIFNFLGPLLNPAAPSAMLIGVPRPELCEPLARVLQSLGVRRAMVVSGAVPVDGQIRYLDELSPLGPTRIAEFYQERALHSSDLSPDHFPLAPASLADLKGGDREFNANVIRQILRGEERGPKRDAVLLNAAAALFVANAAKSLTDGWDLAARTIDSGAAAAKLTELTS
jgi:anthranilate phosphoribosyltransferase